MVVARTRHGHLAPLCLGSDMAQSTGNPVVDAILSGTSNTEVREAMLIGSYLESGWNQNAVGDQGTSFGPFQMHIGGALTAAGGTAADAENPSWAVANMLGAYEAGVNSIPQSTWQSDPETAAEEAAVAAERPAQTYFASDGTGTVNTAWNATQNALKGVVSTSGPPGQSATTQAIIDAFPGGASDPLNWPSEIGNAMGGTAGGIAGGLGEGFTSAFGGIFGWFLNQLGVASLKDLLIRLGLILLGVVILIVGLVQLAHSPGTGSSANPPSENESSAGAESVSVQPSTSLSEPGNPRIAGDRKSVV